VLEPIRWANSVGDKQTTTALRRLVVPLDDKWAAERVSGDCQLTKGLDVHGLGKKGKSHWKWLRKFACVVAKTQGLEEVSIHLIDVVNRLHGASAGIEVSRLPASLPLRCSIGLLAP
jgi:hypothetical protein